MRELECKLSYDAREREKILRWCREQGLKEEGQYTQTDIYYLDKEKSFVREDKALRLRLVEGEGKKQSFICYKGPNRSPGLQDREELETEIGSMEKAEGILSALGFIPAAKVKKTRLSFRKNELSICLDDVDTLGSYIEIEILSETAEASELEKIKAELGLESAAAESRTYLELVARKGRDI